MTPDDLARLDRDLPSLQAIDTEIPHPKGFVEMVMVQDGFGNRKGRVIHVSASEASGHEALGTAERVTDTQERVQRAERHLAKVTKNVGLPRAPSVKELCAELERRGWKETWHGWVQVK
jgi:hypothetical protein